MPEMNVAQSLNVIMPAPIAAASGAADAPDPAAAAAGIDFAAVLKLQLAQPLKDAGAAALAALLPDGQKKPEVPDPSAAAPDLSALLPGLIALVANAAAAPAAAGGGMQASAPSNLLAALASSAAAPAYGSALLAKASAAAAAAQAGTPQPGVPAFALPETDKGDSTAEGDAPAAARQPAVLAVAAMPTAEAAAPASAARQTGLTDAAGETAAATQAHAAAALGHAGSPAASTPVTHVATPVGAPGWDNEVAQSVVWLAGRNDSRAELTLNPPHLGKVEVTLTVSGDQTNALFVSASPTARDALENALPRLREILADAGITLGQASVNAESSHGGADGGSGRPSASGERAAVQVQATAPGPWLRRGNGLVDTFA